MTNRRGPIKRWDEFSPSQQQGIVAAVILTGVWQLVMLIDLWRRPVANLRGSKWAWFLASFVRPFGQIAYFAWGRRPRRP